MYFLSRHIRAERWASEPSAQRQWLIATNKKARREPLSPGQTSLPIQQKAAGQGIRALSLHKQNGSEVYSPLSQIFFAAQSKGSGIKIKAHTIIANILIYEKSCVAVNGIMK
jgi:hypothetical protein